MMALQPPLPYAFTVIERTLTPIVIRPQRLQILVIETPLLIFSPGQIKSSTWYLVIYVPSIPAIVGPRHPTRKPLFQEVNQFADSTPYQLCCPI
jgi:hypothetical protein